MIQNISLNVKSSLIQNDDISKDDINQDYLLLSFLTMFALLIEK